MASLLKQRLIGAIVLISLGIIFIPMLLTGRGNLISDDPQSNVPPKPMYEIQAPKVLPLAKHDAEPAMQTMDEPIEDGSVKKDQDEAEMASIAPQTGAGANDEQPASATAHTDQPAHKPAVKSPSVDRPATGKGDTLPTDSATTAPVAPQQQPAPTDSPVSTAKASTPGNTSVADTSKNAAEAAPHAAPPKPLVSGWVVQLGSFSVEKNALKLRDRLRKKGHASFVEAYKHNGKTSYRVRVGPELSRELAEQLKNRLKEETTLSGLVMSFPQ